MTHIFISYSTKNRDYALRLAEQLRSEGFDVWIDNRRLRTSEDWWRTIVLALRGCAAFVVILTPDSDESPWVQREITLAEKYRKQMFPLLLEGDLDTPNWELFVRIQVADMRDGRLPGEDFHEALAQFAIRQARRGADMLAAPPPPEPIPSAEVTELAEEIANPPDETLPEHPPLAESSEQQADDATELAEDIVHPPDETAVDEEAELAEDIANPPDISEADVFKSPETPPLPLVMPEIFAPVVEPPARATVQPTPSISSYRADKTRFPDFAPLPDTEVVELLPRRRIALPGMGIRTWVALGAIIAMLAVLASLSSGGGQRTGDATATPTPTPSRTVTRTPTAPGQQAVATPVGGGDGELIFASERDGDFEIYSINADGSGLRQLTNNSVDDNAPRWSPDGGQIAFHSVRDGNWEIYVMEADGSNVQRLTRNTVTDAYPAWSPDGSQIVFHTNNSDNWQLNVVNADGSNARTLRDDELDENLPEWSRDSSRIAYNASLDDADDHLYVIGADGGNLRQLTDGSFDDFAPVWSPDGSRIAFFSNRDGDYDIYVMDTSGSNITVVGNSTANDRYPRWSPDSKQIVFFSNRDGDYDVYVMNIDGSNVRKLADTSVDEENPDWRPLVQGADLLESVPTIDPTATVFVPSMTPSISPTAAGIELRGTVIGTERLNVRYGPGTGYSIAYSLAPGTAVTVIGRDSSGTWLRLSGSYGQWVFRDGVSVSGSISSLPVVE